MATTWKAYQSVIVSTLRQKQYVWDGIFFTAGGTFGIGSACMREGDIVVVLFGGDTPYVLRPYGETYLSIGQAYVDDIMQGELVREMGAGGLREQEFCLVR
jgi:hypothetical protein